MGSLVPQAFDAYETGNEIAVATAGICGRRMVGGMVGGSAHLFRWRELAMMRRALNMMWHDRDGWGTSLWLMMDGARHTSAAK